MNIESIKEGLLEAGRVMVVAILPLAISMLSEGKLDIKLLVIAGMIALLKFVDKALHEFEKSKPKKEQNKGILGIKGIVGF